MKTDVNTDIKAMSMVVYLVQMWKAGGEIPTNSDIHYDGGFGDPNRILWVLHDKGFVRLKKGRGSGVEAILEKSFEYYRKTQG
jgi:hypothetical protein